MKKCINGEILEMSAEEITEMQTEQAAHEAYERHRPITESEALSLLLKQQVNALPINNRKS